MEKEIIEIILYSQFSQKKLQVIYTVGKINKKHLGSTMLRATNDDMECGMWDDPMMYRRKK